LSNLLTGSIARLFGNIFLEIHPKINNISALKKSDDRHIQARSTADEIIIAALLSRATHSVSHQGIWNKFVPILNYIIGSLKQRKRRNEQLLRETEITVDGCEQERHQSQPQKNDCRRRRTKTMHGSALRHSRHLDARSFDRTQSQRHLYRQTIGK